jgi:hypothetical protein
MKAGRQHHAKSGTSPYGGKFLQRVGTPQERGCLVKIELVSHYDTGPIVAALLRCFTLVAAWRVRLLDDFPLMN